MDKESYLINQLAERAGVTVRTIRYYVNEGLLPPPQTKGRYSAYDEDYLYRIRLIKFYKESYLPLSRIRALLDHMTPEEIRSTVEMYEKEPPVFNTPPSLELSDKVEENLSAREYLNSIGMPKRLIQEPQVSMHLKIPPDMEERSISPGPQPTRDVSWKRIEIAEGIELLVREDVFRLRRREIEDLIIKMERRDRGI
jgi:DNA-binding transcriptional MerR regulator